MTFYQSSIFKPKICPGCQEEKHYSSTIGLCRECLLNISTQDIIELSQKIHTKVRAIYKNLPNLPPRDEGYTCHLCANHCKIAENSRGYCGVRRIKNGQFTGATSETAILSFYSDHHPTNCCNSWVCPGGSATSSFSVSPGVERGFSNLSVFFHGCNFNCLFCQNASHKDINDFNLTTVEELVKVVLQEPKFTCVCFFGGSPEPHIEFTINFGKLLLEELPKDRIVRLCWEWNGAGNPKFIDQVCELALLSGGNVKFDLKASSEKLAYILTGQSNRSVLRNFERLVSKYYDQRVLLPVITATTLLVSYYIESQEVSNLAHLIASLRSDLPYSLLAFHPDYFLSDLPNTPWEQAQNAYNETKPLLSRVKVGNTHLFRKPIA